MAVIKKKNTDVSKEEEIYMETQWQLMWRKFRKHKLAMLGGIILILLYTVGIFSEFFATQDIAKRSTLAISMAPTQIHFVDAEGNFSIQPFVYGLKQEEDPVTWKKYYVEDIDPQTNERLEEITQNIFGASIRGMLYIFPNAKYYKQSDLIVFIISPEKYERSLIELRLETVFRNIREQIAGEASFTITMGVGDYVDNIKDIHQSYSQARTSINIGYKLERFDCILFYNRMGIYRLLTAVAGTEESEDFDRRYIRPLSDYDAKYHTALLETLEAVAACGWNLKKAGEMLFIHYNSAKYRFSKICEILDTDLHDPEQRLAAEIALKMRMINNNRWS
mgnify:CR=1 FL=1